MTKQITAIWPSIFFSEKANTETKDNYPIRQVLPAKTNNETHNYPTKHFFVIKTNSETNDNYPTKQFLPDKQRNKRQLPNQAIFT